MKSKKQWLGGGFKVALGFGYIQISWTIMEYNPNNKWRTDFCIWSKVADRSFAAAIQCPGEIARGLL